MKFPLSVVALATALAGCSTIGPNPQVQFPADSDAALISYLRARGISQTAASQPMPMGNWQMFGESAGWYVCARSGQDLPTAYVFDGDRVLGSIAAQADRNPLSPSVETTAPQTLPICDAAVYHAVSLS